MIAIREYRDEDWDGVCLVHDSARPIELQGSCDPRAFVPLALDPTAQSIHECEKWVAADADLDGRIVGFVGIDGPYLAWLYVDPQFHRQGVGRRLLRLALAHAGPDAWTICLAENTPALGLYASEGLTEEERWLDENEGYPCTAVRLRARHQSALDRVHSPATDDNAT